MEATPFFPRFPTSCVVIPPGERPDSVPEFLRRAQELVDALRRVAPHAVYTLFHHPYQVHVQAEEQAMRDLLDFLTDRPEHGGLYFPYPAAQREG
jgi:hypothetical protein